MTDMGLLHTLKILLESTGNSISNPSAYDTAWVARLDHENDPKNPAFPEALKWLSNHQHEDGSWGEGDIPERLVSTLTAILALKEKGQRTKDKQQLEQGISFIWHSLFQLQNISVLPIGFELLLSSLVEQNQKAGIKLPSWLATHYEEYRLQKLALLKSFTSNQLTNTSAYFSLEFLDGKLLGDPVQYVKKRGNVGVSPAATVSVLRYVEDPALRVTMLAYLKSISIPETEDNGGGFGWSNLSQMGLFEIIWVLYNIYLCDHLQDPYLVELVNNHLNRVAQSWSADGIPLAEEFICDADDTMVGYTLLHATGRASNLDLSSVEKTYWNDTYLTAYPLERDPSTGVNMHALEAYRLAGQPHRVKQLSTFLGRTRQKGMPFWLDKWHVSPYYATCHAIMISTNLDNIEFINSALDWLIYTQNKNGSWGYDTPTAEETALVVQALVHYARARGWTIPLREATKRGLDFLRSGFQPYILDNVPKLWVGKNRYAPYLIVRSTILSALLLGDTHNL
jgi:halimadienyl-diphosphate synthase